MLKFVSIIISIVFLELGDTSAPINYQLDEVKVEFSERAIGIESGQPIFSRDTKVTVSNPTDTEIKLYINDEEKQMNDRTIEISGLKSDTYTIMIMDAEKTEEKRTVGFTIQ